MEFEICETDQFEERYKSVIPESLKKTATKKIDSLKENADKKGKPIRYPFFREIKLGKFRIYFMVSSEDKAVLLVNVSDKKTQRKIIHEILKNRREILGKLSKNKTQSIKIY